jgi:DNA-binding NtrC family response regulator
VVLIVDDEASIRKTLEGILGDEGISVITAPDGETALEQVKRYQPHLVLLDIWMPGMDGLETLAKIKDLSPHTPVVMISGHANISTALAATRRGAVDFLEKPLDLTSTIKLIHTILQRGSEEQLARAPQWEALTEQSNTTRKASEINPLVFAAQHLRGRALKQKTARVYTQERKVVSSLSHSQRTLAFISRVSLSPRWYQRTLISSNQPASRQPFG